MQGGFTQSLRRRVFLLLRKAAVFYLHNFCIYCKNIHEKIKIQIPAPTKQIKIIQLYTYIKTTESEKWMQR